VVKEVLCGVMQEQILSAFSSIGKKAAGVCGDEGLFQCSKKYLEIDGDRIDLQFVGEIDALDISQVSKLLVEDVIPVVSSLGCDADGNLYNINADAGAAALAAALSAEILCLLTDVDGVFANYPDKESILHSISEEDLNSLIAKVDTGMIPKLEAAKAALDSGVSKVLIANGNSGDALKQSLIENKIVGTMVQQ
jgi:acetylglutamate kinase